ncbi:MAG TPA: hypothetical protein VF773_10510 [Verrucomicrobiae bacterium]
MARIIFTLLVAILTHMAARGIINDPPTVSLRFDFDRIPWVHANEFYTITVSAADANGDLREVRVFSGTNEVASSTNASFSASVFILPGTNEFRAVATDRWGSESAPAVLRIVGNLLPEVEVAPVQAEYNSLEEIPIRIRARDLDGTVEIIRLWNGGQWVGERAPRTAEAAAEIPFTPPNSGIFYLYAEVIDNMGGLKSSISTPTFIVVNASRDDLSRDLPIETGSVNVSASTTGATRQKGEPVHAGVAGGKSIWWGWRNTGGAGTAVIDTIGSSFDTVLAVYRLSATNAPVTFTNLILVAANDDGLEIGTASLVKFSTLPGQVYYIAVDGREGVSGTARLRTRFYSPGPAPVNDILASATMISMSAFVQTTNTSATKEALEPAHAGNPGGASLWWRLIAQNNNAITITTTGSSIDTLLALYTTNYFGYKPGPPSMADLRLIAANDDTAATNRASEVTFVPTPFVSYYIAVDGFNGAEGQVRLRVSGVSTAPQNDAFAAATVLTGAQLPTNGFNLSATREPGEPLHTGKTNGASVWFRWVALTNGLVSISTRTSDFDTILAVYTGNSLTNLIAIAANDDDPASPPTSVVVFYATAGTEYRIAVAGYQNARGEYVLALNQTPTFQPLQPRLLSQWQQGRLWIEPEHLSASAVLESSSDLVTWRLARLLNPGDPPVGITTDAGLGMLFFRIRQELE